MIRPRVGDVFQIPLPNDCFAYGKVFRDASVGIYERIFSSAQGLPIQSSFAFIVGLYDDILKSGTWPIIGNEPFDSQEAEWPPPHVIKDVIAGGYSIYHKGEISPSNEKECEGLEAAAVWDSHHVVERIMGIRTSQ